MASLYEIAKAASLDDPLTKPLRYYEIYDQALREEDLEPTTILELGVHEGQSTKVLATRFPAARIVALDMTLTDIDFSEHGNVTYLQCDQTDRARLQAICEEHFPEGVDLVIDDASHIGHFSWVTFESVFPHLKSRGLYVIEDWGTGYWESRLDGARFRQRTYGSGSKIRKSIPSHSSGMVGFVKSLVDYTAVEDIEDRRASEQSQLARVLLPFRRLNSARRLLGRTPRLKSWLASLVERPARSHSATAAAPPGLPRLRSVKFHRGVCIACKV